MFTVYVGSHSQFREVEPVCEYAIRRFNDQCDVVFLRPSVYGYPDTGCTGFTNMRYVVPLLTEGQAIYIDVDMFLLTDVSELLKYRTKGKWACLVDGANEVIVYDCDVRIPETIVKRSNKTTLNTLVDWEPIIPLGWNSEDILTDDAKLLHLTDLKTQPWFYSHPDKRITEFWEALRDEAYRVRG